MKDKTLDLSVIIPCYNEENVLDQSFKKIKDVLGKAAIEYEIIFVDDCSKDRTTGIIAELMKDNSNVKLIRHESNMGRGRAVEDGLRESRGRVAGFLDIDLQVPAHYITPLFIEVEKGADIATALRIYDMKIHMLHRFALSKGYHYIFDKALKTGIKDSETGYKFFNREKILPVLDEIKDKHWFWDTEVMVRSYLKGLKIVEVPCLCIREEDQKSTVKIFKDIKDYLINLWKFKKEVDRIRREKKIKGGGLHG